MSSEKNPGDERQDGHLAGAVLAGSRWTASGQVAVQATRFLVQIVLARLLAPEDFGLLAVALVTIQFLDKAMDFGTGSALIQRKNLPDKLINTVFLFNVLFGALLALMLFFSSPIVASAFGSPDADAVLRVMSIALIFTAFGNVQQALLRRRLQFRSLALITMVSAFANAIVAIPLAALGAQVWALVAGQISLSVTASLGAHLASGWRVSRGGDIAGLLSLRKFSVNLAIFNLFSFALRNSDKLIVGRFLGVRALGIYAVAERVLIYPQTIIANSLTQVLFPALARTQTNKRSLQRGVFRAVGATTLITFPVMVGIATVAEPFTLAFLGSRWSEIVPLILVLGPTAALGSIALTTGTIFTAVGQTRVLLYWGLFSNTLLVVAFLIGAQFSLFGVALSYFVVSALLTWPANALALRLIDLRFRQLARLLLPVSVATGMMAAAVLGIDFFVDSVLGLTPWPRFILGVGTGGVVYAMAVVLLRPPGLAELISVLGLQSLFPGIAESARPID